MEENPDYERDLASIRNLMERSVKFISLSGLAGVVMGLIALLASAYIYSVINSGVVSPPWTHYELMPNLASQLVLIGTVTLITALAGAWYFSYRKAQRHGQSLWNATSQRLLINLGIPLVAGGIFILIMLLHGYYGLVAPLSLLFYGLALVAASPNLYAEIRWLGYSEIVLGLLAAVLVRYGLVFWAAGFGVLHIVYGLVMVRKYDS